MDAEVKCHNAREASSGRYYIRSMTRGKLGLCTNETRLIFGSPLMRYANALSTELAQSTTKEALQQSVKDSSKVSPWTASWYDNRTLTTQGDRRPWRRSPA